MSGIIEANYNVWEDTDEFFCDMDMLCTRLEELLKGRKKQDHVVLNVQKCGQWNVWDIEETLENEHYAYKYFPDLKKIYIALDKERLEAVIKQKYTIKISKD